MTKSGHRAAVGALLLASLGLGPSAFGQAYPSRTITILTPFAAGSVTDAAARVIAQTLQDARSCLKRKARLSRQQQATTATADQS